MWVWRPRSRRWPIRPPGGGGFAGQFGRFGIGRGDRLGPRFRGRRTGGQNPCHTRSCHGAGFSAEKNAERPWRGFEPGEHYGTQATGDDRCFAHRPDRRVYRLGALPVPGRFLESGTQSGDIPANVAGPPLLCGGGREPFDGNRPESVRTLVAAHLRATDYIQQNPESRRGHGVKHTGLDPETIRQAMRIVDYNYRLNVRASKPTCSSFPIWAISV
jgi:hypothetical protein